MAIGGFDGTNYLNSVEIFTDDIRSREWKTGCSMNHRRLGSGVGILCYNTNDLSRSMTFAIFNNLNEFIQAQHLQCSLCLHINTEFLMLTMASSKSSIFNALYAFNQTQHFQCSLYLQPNPAFPMISMLSSNSSILTLYMPSSKLSIANDLFAFIQTQHFQ
ncbi:hypothetical protein GJ496_008407 [Pomphorhynchus laevis]|nr:hypothetical protein GJ496_008407 [Pomphorhynchus laevis]